MTIVHLAGHLGADPEVRMTPSGQKVTSLRVAVNQRKGKEDVTVWWRVTIWGDQFERMMPYLKKGSGIMAIGEMQPPEVFADRDGNQRISMECTAVHLAFSPFGRTDKKEGESTGAGAGAGVGGGYGGMVETGGPRQAAPAYGGQAAGVGPRAPMAAGTLSDTTPF